MTTAMPHSARHYQTLLAQGRWFGSIDPGLRDYLLDHATVRRLAVNERIFSRGETFNGLFAVISGVIRISGFRGPADSGKEALLALVEAPDWIGEMPLFDRQLRSHDAWAETAAIVAQVPAATLHALLAQQPHYWREFALLLTHKLRLTFAAIEQVSVLNTPGRLAYRLLMMADRYGGASPGGGLPPCRMLNISQEQLAQLLAISRQTANPILKGMEQQQLIRLHRNGIELLDLDGLRALATGS
jgi:CRP-like cAMP-binding protein